MGVHWTLVVEASDAGLSVWGTVSWRGCLLSFGRSATDTGYVDGP